MALELQKGDPFKASRWLHPQPRSASKTAPAPEPPPSSAEDVAESAPSRQPAPEPGQPRPSVPVPRRTPAVVQPTPVAEATPTEVAVRQPAPLPTPASLPYPTPAIPKEGRLAIVIDDCGYAGNEGFIAIETPLTLAVLPHVPHSRSVAEQAVAQGKEVILHLPMEPKGDSNPGPGALRTNMDGETLRRQIRADFEAVPGISGLNNHQGSKASADDALMTAVLEEARSRGVYYLDSRTTNATVAPELAPKLGVPFLSRDIFLDNVDDVDTIIAQLRRAEEVAKIKGAAVAIGHPRANTLEAIRRWLPEARVEVVSLGQLR